MLVNRGLRRTLVFLVLQASLSCKRVWCSTSADDAAGLGEPHRKIIFNNHSMGGLFTRAALSEAVKLDKRWRLWEPWHLRVCGMIDWGVPFQGPRLLSALGPDVFSGV